MGSGLIVGGAAVQVLGLDVTNWRDSGETWSIARGARPARCGGIRAVIWHTTRGLPSAAEEPASPVLAGAGASHGLRASSYDIWDHANRCPGAHAVVDHDGSVYQVADIATDETSWCHAWSRWSVNLALFQGPAGELYEAQLAAAVLLTDAVTRATWVQRQVPHRYLGSVPRLAAATPDVVGVLGHRDAAKNRGPGDPGSALFYRLGLAGYDPVDYALMGDRSLWVRRQRQHGIAPDDGVAGPETVAALKAAGIPHGIWVRRPGD